jgi:hypothetical protein
MSDRHALVLELFEKMGGQKMVDRTIESTLDAMKTVLADAPEELWSELRGGTHGDPTVARAWEDSLERAFEPDELQLLLDFYSASHGQKMADALPRMVSLVSATMLRWQKEVLMPRLEALMK